VPCHIPLFPCYSLSLLEIISIRHCYTCLPEKHNTPHLSSPSCLLLHLCLACSRLPAVVFSRAQQNVLFPILKDGYRELSFICSLLALSPYAPTPRCSGCVLFIHYLVLTTCLVLYKPENEDCLVSRKFLYRTDR